MTEAENEIIEVIRFYCGETMNKYDREQLLHAIDYIKELSQYHAIGTVTECRDAAEKQKPKIPDIWGDGCSDGQLVYDSYECPNCGEIYEIDCDRYNYCPNCGQRIDRTDLERI